MIRTARLFLAALALCALAAGHAATPTVGAGNRHALAVAADGSMRAWGDDSAGQLGLGRVLTNSSPTLIPGLPAVSSISAGMEHVVALLKDGTVWAWGRNDLHQLGDGSTTNRSTPAPVIGLSGIVSVSVGGFHTLALRNDGTVWAWGTAWSGQLGIPYPQPDLPAQVPGLTDVVAISAGYIHSLALKRDGSVVSWGANFGGQLGNDSTQDRPAPGPVLRLRDVVRISAGVGHSVAITRDGNVWAWGVNEEGTLGDGTTTQQLVPVPVRGISDAKEIRASYNTNIVLTNDGAVWYWGWGFGTITTPTRVDALQGTTAIAAGMFYWLALSNDGVVRAMGQNEVGQLGDGTTTERRELVRVNGLPPVVAIAAGGSHTYAITGEGRVYAWGGNDYGELGDSSRVIRSTPSTVPGATGIKAIAAGGLHSLALRNDGAVLAWGSNSLGQLGDGTRVSRSTPGLVPGLAGVRAVAAGYYHSMALKEDGTVWMWGYGYDGQIGNGTNSGVDVPTQVAGLSRIDAIATGGAHVLALARDGTIWAWGSNGSGQLGDGTNAQRLIPVRVTGATGLTDIKAISAGEGHTLALTNSGTVWSWGRNYSGELGDGTNTDRYTPGPVPGLSGVSDISAGSSFSHARRSDGTLWAWGANWGYQLGDGTYDEQLSPVPIRSLEDIAAVSAGGRGGIALKADGTVLAWGGNIDGRLGDGTFIDRASPVVVLRDGGGGSIAGRDWFLDLNPAVPKTIPSDKVPVFLLVAASSGGDFTADLHYRAQDVGTTGSVYVFARAPATIVKAASDGSPPLVLGKAVSRNGSKADSVACVLAQLSSTGQLIAVTAAQLQAYLSGVLSAQGASVSILNGTPAGTVAGATFFVGYGSNSGAMINNGTNRSVVTVPGARECKPQAPQTGWWWNPAEGGRGFSIEVAGNHILYAAFLYDDSGRSRWYVATGTTSLDGSLFTGDLLDARNGQTLFGDYRAPTLATVGPIALTFDDAAHGTLVWPGGAIPIERFNIMPGGLTSPPQADQPENGWWWNPAESGRGFFIEWQNGTGGPQADLAGYMYDDAGNPVWYLSVYPTPDSKRFSGNWWSFANGQTLTGAYKPAARINENVAPVTVQFHTATTATLTLPGGRTVPLARHRF